MSFFKKLFSSNYRKAVAAEGAGRYKEAAEHYMLADERGSVARMHRLVARDETDPFARVKALRQALDLLPEHCDLEDTGFTRQAIRSDLADAIVEQVELTSVMDRRDRAMMDEAAAIYMDLDEVERAGEVYAKLGHLNKAAEAFQKAGNIKRMEEMYQRAESVDVSAAEFDRAWDTYEFASMAGDYLGAIEALRRCVELKPHDAGLSARLQVLRERMPSCARICLRSSFGQWVLVGGHVVHLGREETNEILLPQAGVSRRHARLSLRGEEVHLEDLDSRHGTSVGVTKLQRPTPLTANGSFQVGRDIDITYSLQTPHLFPAHFHVTSGYLKGQSFLWTQDLLTTGTPPSEPEWLPAGLALRFMRDFWHIIPEACQGPVLINGTSVQRPTLLRLNDEITYDGHTLYVE